MSNPLLLAFFIVAMGVTTVLTIKQTSRAKRGEEKFEDAITRARKRYGIRRPGVTQDGLCTVVPHPLVRFLSAVVALCGFGFLCFLVYRLRHTPEFWIGRGFFVAFGAVVLVAMALQSFSTRLGIDEDSITFESIFRTRRVARKDIRGYVWTLYGYALNPWAGATLSGPVMQQVIFDKLGTAYVIPNVLKDRIPRDSWLWDLEDLGQGRRRWWPW